MHLPSTKEMELMALIASGELSGREIASAYKDETGRGISYGTLYTTLTRLERNGWVNARVDSDLDGRLKFFSLSSGGRAALNAARAEMGRLLSFGLKTA